MSSLLDAGVDVKKKFFPANGPSSVIGRRITLGLGLVLRPDGASAGIMDAAGAISPSKIYLDGICDIIHNIYTLS